MYKIASEPNDNVVVASRFMLRFGKEIFIVWFGSANIS
jgi:hypothetical protein